MKRAAPEQQLGRAVAEYLGYCLAPGVYSTAINPVALKSPIAASMSKAMGMKAGCADWLIVHGGRALFVELKSATGKLSAAQVAARRDVEAAGSYVEIVRSIEDLRAALKRHAIPTVEAAA